jgi:hypothetical protein
MAMITGSAGGSTQAIPEARSLSTQAASMLERLDRSIDTARSVSDRLYGHRPREAGNNSVKGDPSMPSLERMLEHMHDRMSALEDELARANTGL